MSAWAAKGGMAVARRLVAGSVPFSRRLRFEPLEERRLLSITVNTRTDEADGSIVDGDISLRDAIALGAPGETINFAPALTAGGPATLTLTLGQLTIAKDLTINGPGANLLTIDASGNDPTPAANDGNGSRILFISDGTTALKSVAIGDVTLTGGDVLNGVGGAAGGAIYCQENLTLDHVTISGNSAALGGGLRMMNGTATVADSLISGNTATGFMFGGPGVLGGGGGISSSSTLNLVSSTVTGNSANSSSGAGGAGGGIFADYGPINMTFSTVSGNSADGYGGGVFGPGTITSSTISGNSAHSGGGATTIGLATFLNSTISGNTAFSNGGGIFRFFGSVEVRHSTIANNSTVGGTGGGVSSGSTAPTVDHTIIGDNRAGGVANDIAGSYGALNVNYSLIEAPGGHPVMGPGSIVGVDPILGPLANNGGPTKTQALRGWSPAIDAGDPAAMVGVGGVPAFDQRGAGFSRVVRGGIDIGAYEATEFGIVVDTLMDEDDGDYSVGDVSLREAIRIANTKPGPDTITFAPALNGGTILLSQPLGSLKITTDMTISASSLSAGLTVDGHNGADGLPATMDGFSLFVVDDMAFGALLQVEMIGLTLTGANEPANGGAILSEENLTLTNCQVLTNVAGSQGGGICSGNGGGGATLTVTGSTVSANSAGTKGGGIFSYSYLKVINSTISTNQAGTQGGGICEIIHGPGLKLKVTGSTVFDNEAIAQGGGIFLETLMPDPKPAVISDSTISTNRANADGGGILIDGGPLFVEYSTITLNKADADFAVAPGEVGGGIVFGPHGGSANLSHTIVAANVIAGAPAIDDDINVINPLAANTANTHYCVIGITTALAPTDDGTSLGLIGPVGGPPIDPKLGSLANNGGPTKTHALLAGSPALTAGDPLLTAGFGGVPDFDQRGAPFGRISGPAIDIGAYEKQLVLPATFGDYNQNGVVDAADYVVWRKTLGTTGVPAYSGADGDGDTTIDQDDYDVWRAHFGQMVPPPGSGAGEASSVRIQELSADAPVVRNIAADYIGESVVQIPTETISAPTETDVVAARASSFAALETRSHRNDSSTRSRRTIDQYRVAESGGDDLPLLLAIDRVWRTPQQDSFVNDDSGNGEHRAADDGSESEIDEPLAVALAVRRGARSTCIVPG